MREKAALVSHHAGTQHSERMEGSGSYLSSQNLEFYYHLALMSPLAISFPHARASEGLPGVRPKRGAKIKHQLHV